jgi:hypothetical protein
LVSTGIWKRFYGNLPENKSSHHGKKNIRNSGTGYLLLKDEGTTIVLTSNTGIEPANPTVMFSNKSAEDIVALLEEKNQPEAVIVGGMATVTEFLSSGSVDEIHLGLMLIDKKSSSVILEFLLKEAQRHSLRELPDYRNCITLVTVTVTAGVTLGWASCCLIRSVLRKGDPFLALRWCIMRW